MMQTRWMLYLEDGDTLRLLTGVPRAWLKAGAQLAVKNAGGYFGPLTFAVAVSADGKNVQVTIECPGDRRPRGVELRVPHPQEQKALSVEGGKYEATTETVHIVAFDGRAVLRLSY